MSGLARALEARLAPGMTIPEPIAALYDWIEARGTFVDTPDGRIGLLYPQAELKAGWTDDERPGGTIVEFVAEGSDNMRYWFGTDESDPDIERRLCVFARTGAEGSMAAFWLDDGGRQRIVHLGSGSGSTLVCVLADEAIDFLRLLAIGYDEICWGAFDVTPAEEGSLVVHPNEPYRAWLRDRYGVTIPATGAAIVRHRAFLGDEASDDPFWRWVRTCTG